MTDAFYLPVLLIAVAMVIVGLIWIGLLQRRQKLDKATVPARSIVPIAVIIIGGMLIADQIWER
jgi:hypothetical protein